jgi:4-amino-4-deoxy-L-arabinose transferase-like glycosyltransferase
LLPSQVSDKPISYRSGTITLGAVRRHWAILLSLVAFGLTYSVTLDSLGILGWDEAEYASIGRSVLHGQGFTVSGVPNELRPPVLPLAGTVGMFLAHKESDSVLHGVSLVFALLAILGLYGLVTVATDRCTGYAAAVILAASPLFRLSTSQFLSEIPFMTFFTPAVVLFYLGIYRREAFFPVSWLCFGVAFLTRYTAVVFFPIALCFVLIAYWSGGDEARRRITSRSFLFSPIGGLLVIAPWLIRQYVTFGDAFVGLERAATQLQKYVPGVQMPSYFYLAHIPATLSLPAAILAVGAAFWALRSRDRFAIHCLVSALVILIWFSVYRYKEDRLASSALPFLAILAALGLMRTIAGLRRPAFRAPAFVAFLAGLCLMNFLQTRNVLSPSVTLGYPAFLDALDFLRGNASSDGVILGASRPQIFWYTGRTTIDFPTQPEFPESLRRAEWVVITNFERGQKEYVNQWYGRIAPGIIPSARARVFRSGSFVTVVLRTDSLPVP